MRHGQESWFYTDGKKKYEVTYRNGVKVGQENFWRPGGALRWSWTHHPDGVSTWTQYRADGSKRSESNWRGFKAEGVATRWNHKGVVMQKATFRDGALVD